uniref:Major facilitator superfamily (MFS) profile domain-containing protein n=1 Tax=Romanomermis culicivorax TaxID=13658 RepID=A0A915IMN6_ROMCU
MAEIKSELPPLNEKERSILLDLVHQNESVLFGNDCRAEAVKRKAAASWAKGRITGWLLISILAASLGSSFIYGYNIGVINVAGNTIQRWIAESQQFIPMNTSSDDPLGKTLSDKVFLDSLNENDKAKITFVWSLVGGIFPLGAMFGGLMSGAIADKFGRKGGMLLNNLLTFAAGLVLFCTKWSGSYYILWLGRFLIGINSGLNSSLAPMYLTEIAPVNYRGLLGSVSQLVGTIAILIANILGFEFLLGTETLWPYLLGFTIVPAIWQLATLPLCPESPKYLLISKGQHDHARN